MEKITIELIKREDFPKGYGVFPSAEITERDIFDILLTKIPKTKKFIRYFTRTEWVPYIPEKFYTPSLAGSVNIPTGTRTEFIDVFVEDR